MTKIAEDTLERYVLSEIDSATDFVEKNISPQRTKSWDRYYGRPLGNERQGRSKFISRDVMDTIEWMMPYFVQMFTAGEPKIKVRIKGQDRIIGEAIRAKIQEDLDEGEQNTFLLFYQWIKDSLVSNTGFVKPHWFLDVREKEKTLDSVTLEQFMQLANDPDLEVMDYTLGDESITDVKIKTQQVIKDKFQAEGLPCWEVLVSENAKNVNDETGKGHKTRVSIDYLKRVDRAYRVKEDEPFFKHLNELEEGNAPEGGTSGTETSSLDSEKEQYRGYYNQEFDDNEYEEQGARRQVDFIEWYDRFDINDDGYLEDIICWVADNRLIRWEENKDGFINLCALSPILDCYKFFGISWAQLIEELQLLKTMILRRMLDNFDFANSGRWRVTPGSSVDTRALLNNAPGEIVRGRKDEIEDLTPRGINMQAPLAILQYTDTMKEERSGVTKVGQGRLDSQTGAQMQQGQMPDRGLARLMTAAQQRMDLIARIFAETGIKDFYQKAVWLYQKHLQHPFTIEVRGQEIQVQPEQLQGEVVCTASLSIDTAVGQQEASKIQGIFQFVSMVAQQFPEILAPKEVHHMVQQFISGYGWSTPGEFIPTQEAFVQAVQQRMQQQQQGQQAQQQQMQQMQQFQMQMEQLDKKIDQAKIEQQERESIRSAQQDETESLRNYMLEAAKLLKEGQNEQAQQMLDAARIKQEELKNVRESMDRSKADQGTTVSGRAGSAENTGTS